MTIKFNSCSSNSGHSGQSSSPLVMPFLKWAGGKRWLTPVVDELAPKSYVRYLEPFLGSGAIFFHLNPNNALLGDSNHNLIETYISIRDEWAQVEKCLAQFQKKHSSEYYYFVRQKHYTKRYQRAAQFIYLNRTCWNGLYRVNLSGIFNVPIGTKQSVLLDSDNFAAVSSVLKNTTLVCADYQTIIDQATENDFVFVDPPYTINHNLNGFIKYNEKLFTWDDQIRLKVCLENAVRRGAKILLTNAAHQSVKELYSGLGEMMEITRRSVIAGKNSGRGAYAELLVKSY